MTKNDPMVMNVTMGTTSCQLRQKAFNYLPFIYIQLVPFGSELVNAELLHHDDEDQTTLHRNPTHILGH